jgi:hypothetical protein
MDTLTIFLGQFMYLCCMNIVGGGGGEREVRLHTTVMRVKLLPQCFLLNDDK